ncbi:putative glycosyltransferase [Candidatus Jidaibacter acanthamoeba]|uniref:Putative glycosyltransferase n=1 Tax=Candidatus Jidaibacter acanthamoebae TaxID=86105 RepID=A0A0C1QK12_9RICK|nr:glycosyltransferase family 2 protein [Candidatus Jidaibacter acanthamoeba]KIE05879.1 putative glycosyltransferase [Candidatus Jidaibacter acanthamoeba]
MRQEVYKISIVIPCYNESQGIKEAYMSIMQTIGHLKKTYEIIFINDGSQDDTIEALNEIYLNHDHIKIIDLTRNFGKEAALTCGLDYASGDIIIPMDADFQDPPELIPSMISLWQQGYDVVLAKRNNREGESFIKKFTAKMFYKLFLKLSKTPLPENTGDFRLMDKKVVEKIKLLREKNRFMKGIFSWVGFKTATITFDRPKRKHGQTSWDYRKLFSFALDGIFSFSTLPLKIWLYIGVMISLFSLSYALFLVLRTIFYGIELPGYASIMVAILFMGGVQLISLGVIGEYIARVYKETKNRPIYLINEVYTKDEEATK